MKIEDIANKASEIDLSEVPPMLARIEPKFIVASDILERLEWEISEHKCSLRCKIGMCPFKNKIEFLNALKVLNDEIGKAFEGKDWERLIALSSRITPDLTIQGKRCISLYDEKSNRFLLNWNSQW